MPSHSNRLADATRSAGDEGNFVFKVRHWAILQGAVSDCHSEIKKGGALP